MPLGSMYVEVDPPIARVVLNRPETNNPMSEEWRTDLQTALAGLKADPNVSVVILKGNGRGLSAGGDLNFVAENFGGESHHDRETCFRLGRYAYQVLWQFPKPLILQVHGFLLGGSVSLAAVSDIVIVEDEARIGTPETRALGHEPFLGFWALTMGARWTKLLLYTGDVIDGRTAAEIGMATKAVPAAELEPYTEWIARRIARVGRETLTIQKEAVNAAFEIMGLEASVNSTIVYNHASHATEATREFKRRIQQDGIREAITWRDAAFGGRLRLGAPLPLLEGPPKR